MHSWSEKDCDWKGISDAAYYIGDSLRKWGRVPVRDMKEKWGTVRVYCDFGWHQLHDICYPGYAYSQFPKWLWKLDCSWLGRLVRISYPIISWYHRKLYTHFYGQALAKWPHLRAEILQGADHPELLAKFGVHIVRTAERMYETHYDWHPNQDPLIDWRINNPDLAAVYDDLHPSPVASGLLGRVADEPNKLD